MGAPPDDHQRLAGNDMPPGQIEKVRGVFVGEIPAAEILTWEDFEAG